MARPERPLDADGGGLAEFAAGLRALRDQAGRPGYRELAQVAHYSATTLSDAAGGRAFPSLAVTLAYVRACGGSLADWERRWHAIAAHRASRDRSTDVDPANHGSAPYVGLAAFEPHDAQRFFGRADVTEDLVRRVRELRFVAVFGASGAGKSSVLRAGLMARVRQSVAGPVVVLMTPGSHPVEECAVALATLTGTAATEVRAELLTDPDALHLQICQALADRPAATDLLLVVDQFEEVFTLCHDEQERRAFIAALVRATRQPTSRLRVVLGVRTDFYTHCARVPELVDALRDSQVLVGPMTPEQLRSAISQPAVHAHCTVEAGLLAAVIADCAGEPAVLPLLSHALLETWRRRRGNTLTLSGYQAAGGIAHAITHTAEQAYTRLDARRQRLVKSLFMRLTALGEGTEDTKRRIHRDEFDTTDPDRAAVLEALTQARLITVDHEWIEISHEALIRYWPRLRGWMDSDRDGMRIHRQLTDATNTWLVLERDPDSLYRGSRLMTAQEWHTTTDQMLNPNEREFLTASLAAQARDRSATRRRARRLRQLVALLSVLLVVATATTVTALQASRTASQQRNVALAENALNEAAAVRTAEPELALQLTLAASHLARTTQTDSGLLNALTAPYIQRLGVSMDAVSPDGRLMANVRNGRTAELWDLSSPHQPMLIATITALASGGTSAGFSPDGRIFTVSETTGTQLWDVTTPRHPRILQTLPNAERAVFDADEHRMATIETAGVRVWDSTDPHRPVPLATLPTGQAAASSLALSRDGRSLAIQSPNPNGVNSSVRLWDLTNPHQPRPTGVTITSVRATQTMAFSPTAPILAAATDNGPIVLWDVTHPGQPTLAGSLDQAGRSFSVTFSADGRTVATGSGGGEVVTLWYIDTPSQPQRMIGLTVSAEPIGINMIGFGRGARTLAITLQDGVSEWITLPQFVLASKTQGVVASISPDGHTLVTIGGALNGAGPRSRTQIWDLTDLGQLTPTATLSLPGGLSGGVAFSPHAPILAININSTQVQLWDLASPQHPHLLAILPESGDLIGFGSDGQILATISGHLWDVSQPRHPRALNSPNVFPSPELRIALSGHGHALARFSPGHPGAGATVQLWDTANPSPLRLAADLPGALPGSLPVAFSPDGRLLVTGNIGHFQLWSVNDLDHPTLVATMPTTSDANSFGESTVAFSPDGHTLATAAPDQTIQLWDITNPAHPTAQGTLTHAQLPVMFYPNGRTLAVIGPTTRCNYVKPTQTPLPPHYAI